jgi:hypothetical protein
MSLFVFGTHTDISGSPTPSTGWNLGYDLDGILKQKDINGIVTPIIPLGSAYHYSLINTNGIGLTTSVLYLRPSDYGHTASGSIPLNITGGQPHPVPEQIMVGGPHFGTPALSTGLNTVAVRDNSYGANGTAIYPQFGVSVGQTYSGGQTAGIAAISTQVLDGTYNRRSALFTNYNDMLWGLSNAGTTGAMTFGIWQSTNRIVTIGANNRVNFQPGGTHSDSGYFFTVGSQSYFKDLVTITYSGSGLKFTGLTAGSTSTDSHSIGVDSNGLVVNSPYGPKINNVNSISSSLTYSLSDREEIYIISTTYSGTPPEPEVYLPLLSDIPNGKILTIKDGDGYGASNNIHIQPTSPDVISDVTIIPGISSDFGYIKIIKANNKYYKIG